MISLTVNADNLLKNGDAESELENWSNTLELSTDNHHSGQAAFKMVDSTAQSTELIPVDPEKKYRLSGWFKSANAKPALILLGLMSYDAEKRLIRPMDVSVVLNTETKLAQDCLPDDTTIKVTDASKWKEGDIYSVAFAADDSGNYNDLPNRNITGMGIKSINQAGEIWEVFLSKPCGKTFPAGTTVRQHCVPNYSYPYVVCSPKFNSEFWKELSGTITGMSKTTSPGDKFWRGTKYVRLIILSLNGGLVYFDDIKLEEVKE
jgi:hypothetical protein